MSGEESEVASLEEAVSEEIEGEEAPVMSREEILEKIEASRHDEALRGLLEYVDFKIQEILGKSVAPFIEKVEGMAEVVKDVQFRLLEIEKAPPEVVFTEEDRKSIVEAFKGVHKELGSAFGTLASKDIGYRVSFDSKKGLLSVRLFKLVESE